MKPVLAASLGFLLLGSGVARAQDDIAPAQQEQAAQPTTQPPAEQPPAPPQNVPAPPQQQAAAQQQPTNGGQWVYTNQYGWLWMPYGQQYTYQPTSDDAAPYEYVYEPSYGWSWLEAPWVWGWGPSPWFGAFGPGRFGWYRHGWAYNGYGWRGYRGGYHFGAGRAFAGRPGFYRPGAYGRAGAYGFRPGVGYRAGYGGGFRPSAGFHASVGGYHGGGVVHSGGGGFQAAAAAGTAAVIASKPRRSTSSPQRPHWRRRLALAGAVVYLAFVWLDAVGSGIPAAILPLPARFFVQVAQLFPRAAVDAIEWRAKGFHCDRRKFEELDLAPYFPIHADDKENRFDRALFFYLEDKRVLEALDAFIVDAEGKLGDRIGGVMLLSLRTPIAPPGSDEPRYERVPVDSLPPSVKRTYWYVTGADERERRCR